MKFCIVEWEMNVMCALESRGGRMCFGMKWLGRCELTAKAWAGFLSEVRNRVKEGQQCMSRADKGAAFSFWTHCSNT